MKRLHRTLALMLCAALLIPLCACTEKTDPIIPTDSTIATDAPVPENPAAQLYEQARAVIDEAQDVSMRISVKKSITVGGETFEENSEQKLIFYGLGTNYMRAYCEELFGISTREYYSNNTVYLLIDDIEMTGSAVQNMKYSCKPEEFLASHYPTVMLDVALYRNITVTEGQTLTTLTMAEPTVAESWALPDGAQFLSGSGIARIDTNGSLHSTIYTVQYQYGNAVIDLEVTSYLSLTPDEFTLPERAQHFPKIADIDAVKLQYWAAQHLTEASKLSATSQDTYLDAAGQYETDYTVTLHFNAENRMFRRKSDTTYADRETGEYESYGYEDFYINNLYHIVEDDQDTLKGTLSWTEASYYCRQHITRYMIPYFYWETATITDLGSTYLIEYTYTDSIALLLADSTCYAIYGDSKFLERETQKHKTYAISGYLGVDKFTGLPTSSGIYYVGSYIDGAYEYPLLAQIDTAIDVPSLGSYKAIAEEMPKEAKPESLATPLFYHVTGNAGQEMWLLGTVHVGDERTAYLPQEIYNAFDGADAVALEFNIDALEEQLQNDEKIQAAIALCYYYTDGSLTMDHLSTGTYNDGIKFLKASGNYNAYVDYLKPYFWTSMLDSFYLQQGYTLTSDQGVDMRLTDRALAQGKKILEVESAESQIAMFSGFSDELQEYLLMDLIYTDPIDYWQDLNTMYDTWCTGDEESMRRYLSTDPETLAEMTQEERALYEEYNNAISLNRNRQMLETAISYLESGDTVFFAVGLAHLLVDEGLVDTLRDAGYSVELVTYSEQ